ncbi:MAG: hypothetical protein Kow00107_05060 [Planctomycetota bacterium]
MTRMKALAVLVICMAAVGIAFAEEQPAGEKAVKLTAPQIMKQIAPYILSVEGKKADIERIGGNIAIRIEGAGREWMAQAMDSMSEPDRMAVWISESTVMFPLPPQGRGGVVLMGGAAELDDPTVAKIHLPDGKTHEGVKLGKISRLGLGFATVLAPEGFKPSIFKFAPSNVQVGQKIFLVGRRQGEWKFVPFFLEATVNGELPTDEVTFFSLNLSQEILSSECMGAVAVDENMNFLGLVTDIPGKKHSVVLARPDYFMDAIETALDRPDELEPFEAPVIHRPGIVIPQPPQPEENQDEPRAFLGVNVSALTAEKAKELGLEEPMGLLIEKIGEGSPAEMAGLKVNDVILEAGGLILEAPSQLKALIEKHEPGDELEFVVFRDGKQFTLKVTLGKTK